VAISNFLKKICNSEIFEKSVVVLILLNTLFLATEYYNQPGWLTEVQTAGNLFFTIIFAVEMLMKMFAYGLR
jgi:hypothetical protein